jgi:hypothetical protein
VPTELCSTRILATVRDQDRNRVGLFEIDADFALCLNLYPHIVGSGAEEGKKGHHGHHKMTLPTVSNYTIRDTEDNDNAKQEGSIS